jgi:hypothetical protein
MENVTGGRWTKSGALIDVPYEQTGQCIVVRPNGFELVDYTRPGPDRKAIYSRRGGVATFSARSRRRLMQLLASLHWADLGPGVFVTLTYHHGWRADAATLKSHLKAWLQWHRDQELELYYIWRLEWQRRGAIHYHVMMWPKKGSGMFIAPEYISRARAAWHRIADPTSMAHESLGLHCIPITCYRQAAAYVSKYVAKEQPETCQGYEGRRWGCSDTLPTRAIIDIDVSGLTMIILREIAYNILVSSSKVSPKFLCCVRDSPSLWLYISPDRLLAGIEDYLEAECKPPELVKLAALLRQWEDLCRGQQHSSAVCSTAGIDR